MRQQERESESLVAPLRGRGLKLPGVRAGGMGRPVAPLRGRGLKQRRGHGQHHARGRSLTGAWIETVRARPDQARRRSLPYGGVD